MYYIVRKNTANEIESAETPKNLLINALHAGFEESEVEILTEEEYQARKALEPQPIQVPSEIEILQAKLNSATQQLDFQEELIVELAMMVYQ